jgi:hypothetical protein
MLLKNEVEQPSQSRSRATVILSLEGARELSSARVVSVAAGCLAAAALVGFVLLTLVWWRVKEDGRRPVEGDNPQ